MVKMVEATKDNLDSALEKAHKDLPQPTGPDAGIMAAFSVFRTQEEKVRALIYAVGRIGGKGLAEDLRKYNTAARGVYVREVSEASDTSPTDKG